MLSTLEEYIRTSLASVPSTHWLVMGLLPVLLMAFLLARKRTSVYGAIALGIAFYIVLFLLETALVIRCCDLVAYTSGFDFDAEYNRFFRGTIYDRRQIFFNIAVFIPFGFFLSEFLSVIKMLGSWRQIGIVTLSGLALSLFIESLQLILHVGVFEVTDLVMNTVGAFVGAGLSVLKRLMFERKNCYAKH